MGWSVVICWHDVRAALPPDGALPAARRAPTPQRARGLNGTEYRPPPPLAAGMFWLVAGGVLYTAGVPFFVMDRDPTTSMLHVRPCPPPRPSARAPLRVPPRARAPAAAPC
jgi:predicted membrane channel-forming protein YqfA (hemolysin III family)